MNTLRSLSAFGLMLFTVWVFSTTQTLGAEPVCPCESEGMLATAMMRAGFPLAGADPDAVCSTHPVSLPSLDKLLPPSPILFVEAVSGIEPTPFRIFVEFDTAEGVGFCDWQQAGGVQPQPFLPPRIAWGCVRAFTTACQALGYGAVAR